MARLRAAQQRLDVGRLDEQRGVAVLLSLSICVELQQAERAVGVEGGGARHMNKSVGVLPDRLLVSRRPECLITLQAQCLCRCARRRCRLACLRLSPPVLQAHDLLAKALLIGLLLLDPTHHFIRVVLVPLAVLLRVCLRGLGRLLSAHRTFTFGLRGGCLLAKALLAQLLLCLLDLTRLFLLVRLVACCHLSSPSCWHSLASQGCVPLANVSEPAVELVGSLVHLLHVSPHLKLRFHRHDRLE
mmetsp:Transcript_8574/g.17396  ORF Transcript_8574/g.17396 Transcript_8574/m.17396 type:complete len:244 (-) Transcript_8574:43-774(-)